MTENYIVHFILCTEPCFFFAVVLFFSTILSNVSGPRMTPSLASHCWRILLALSDRICWMKDAGNVTFW